jgi:hypothetical protein
MGKEWISRLIQAAAITITLAALCQEMEKPSEERHWHGKLGFIPYDFRLPTIERFRESYWNKDNSRRPGESAGGLTFTRCWKR